MSNNKLCEMLPVYITHIVRWSQSAVSTSIQTDQTVVIKSNIECIFLPFLRHRALISVKITSFTLMSLQATKKLRALLFLFFFNTKQYKVINFATVCLTLSIKHMELLSSLLKKNKIQKEASMCNPPPPSPHRPKNTNFYRLNGPGR